jgi:excinuclease ABC subunit B
MQYERNDQVLAPGRFRVRGDTIDVVPAYESDIIRVELEGLCVRKIKEVNHITGDVKVSVDQITLYPARQYVVPEEKQKRALASIEAELEQRLTELPPLEPSGLTTHQIRPRND